MRAKFKSTGPIPVSELLLDQNNYRLGPLDSQIECIEIMFEEFGSKMTKLAEHISKNGLSPNPIVVFKEDQRWVVLDGNRRITALKCLNNPAEAPDQYKRIFQELRKAATDVSIVSEVECLTADKATIAEYRKLQHTGLQDGAGQVPWGPREIEYLRKDVSGKLKYPIAKAICEYLEKKGIPEARKVSISNMQRLFQDSMIAKQLGFKWDGNQVYFTSKEDEVIAVLTKIIMDFTNKDKTKRKVVGHIYTPEDRKQYVDGLFQNKDVKKPMAISDPVPLSGEGRLSEKPNNAQKTPARQKPPWDRKRLIERGNGLPVPTKEVKLNTILAELASKIDIRQATSAGSVLIRLVLERSVDAYLKNKGINCDNDKLHMKITKAAIEMERSGSINNKQVQHLRKMSQNENLISAHTLNAWVHNPDAIAMPREVCTIWDNIYFFLFKCWDNAGHP